MLGKDATTVSICDVFSFDKSSNVNKPLVAPGVELAHRTPQRKNKELTTLHSKRCADLPLVAKVNLFSTLYNRCPRLSFQPRS